MGCSGYIERALDVMSHFVVFDDNVSGALTSLGLNFPCHE